VNTYLSAKRFLSRLKPYGGLRLHSIRHLRAYSLGMRDGWQQPHRLATSLNIEHLPGYDYLMQDSFDAGINLGQWLRSPLSHQQEN
jgi:hypothetical protein